MIKYGVLGRRWCQVTLSVGRLKVKEVDVRCQEKKSGRPPTGKKKHATICSRLTKESDFSKPPKPIVLLDPRIGSFRNNVSW